MSVLAHSTADFRGSLGRYALFGEIASGGMATVHLARFLSAGGFARTVAIKRLHPHLARDPEFAEMFLEEARLATRVRHTNVVSTLDVVSEDGELFLVMEYFAGESLSRLVRKAREAGEHVPPRYVIGMMCGALEGLHAAHEAMSEKGVPLGIVHRDVSPQNIHVGVDGVARVLDFGIAKATNRVQVTRTDQLKGKVSYMSTEQLAKGQLDRRADVYSASVVLWEALTGQRLFQAEDVPSLVYAIINESPRPPSALVPNLPPGLDAVVLKGLERETEHRWSSAREMAEALEAVMTPAPPREIGRWVERIAGEALQERVARVRQMESQTSSSIPPPLKHASPGVAMEVWSGVVTTNGGIPRDQAPTISNEDTLPSLASIEDIPEFSKIRQTSPSIHHEGEAEETRSRGILIAMIVAGVLLAFGGALLGVRLMQAWDANASAPAIGSGTHPTPAEAESAIRIGVQRAPSAGAGADCDPPYVIERGVRRTKPQCSKR